MRILMSILSTITFGGVIIAAYLLYKNEAISIGEFLTSLSITAPVWILLVSYFLGFSKRLSFGSLGVSSEISKSAREEVRRLEDLDLSSFVSLATSSDSIPYSYFVPLPGTAAIDAGRKQLERKWAKINRKYNRVYPIPIINIDPQSGTTRSKLSEINDAVRELDLIFEGRIFRLCITFSDSRNDDQFLCLVPFYFFEPEDSGDIDGSDSNNIPRSEAAKELWSLMNGRRTASVQSLCEFKKNHMTRNDGLTMFSQIDINRKSIDAITEMLSDESSSLMMTRKGEPFFFVNLVAIMSEVFSAAIEKNKIKRIESRRTANVRENPFAYVASHKVQE